MLNVELKIYADDFFEKIGLIKEFINQIRLEEIKELVREDGYLTMSCETSEKEEDLNKDEMSLYLFAVLLMQLDLLNQREDYDDEEKYKLRKGMRTVIQTMNAELTIEGE